MIVNNVGPPHTALEFWNPCDTESTGGDLKIKFNAVDVSLGVIENCRLRPGTRCEYSVADTELRCSQGNLSYHFLNPALGIREVGSINVQDFHRELPTESVCSMANFSSGEKTRVFRP